MVNAKRTNMTDTEFYNAGIDFLMSFDDITKQDMDVHLLPQHTKPFDLKIIYRKLCDSAQNKQMSTKVIGNAIGGVGNLKDILFNFDPHKVAEKYSKNDSAYLLSEIKEKLKPRGQMRETTRSLWPLYCKSIIDSAHFLNTFDTAEKFYDWANFFAHDSKSKPALPLIISMEIYGFGFPLACDFLKELGFAEYGKPDVHIRDIFEGLNIIEKNEKDYAILKVMDRIAHENNVSTFAVDKVFWLIGSGDFHITKKNIKTQKWNFINSMQRY